MGTFGSGLFDSDTVEDFLDALEEQPTAQRLMVVERTLRAGIETGGSPPPSVLPEEVIVAAAVVAANLQAGRSLTWHEEYPDIAGWLPKPVEPALAACAVQALEATLPADGWWWRSWVHAEDRADAQEAIDELRTVLTRTGPSPAQT
jgi:alpha-glucosidase